MTNADRGNPAGGQPTNPPSSGSPQRHPHQAPAGPGYAHYPYPGFAPPQGDRPLLNTGTTRALGALTIVAWVFVILFGFLNFTLITPHESGVASTANGWGRWTHLGPAIELYDHTSASLLMVDLFPTMLLMPAVAGAILILFNLGRRPLFAMNAVFAALATAAIGYFVANPDDTTLVFDSHSNDYIMEHYTYATGTGGYLILATCVTVVLGSIIGAVLARKGPPAMPR